ncbi:MAG: hypothetical protein HKN94_09535 [Acidimicrobiales bacterium]|nr:hypothetical protein [Acidimicrobiia bacterium]NNC80378.1 hypothetical protein [Acidimicrobiales bacterium]RZV42264.1 MAG: hypothetical protein EX269_15125 [Acidimicrobiales bacterium]
MHRTVDRGAGLFSMAVGVLMFFALLVFVLQVLINLYTTSVVTSLAIDAAHDVARLDGVTAAQAEAEFANAVGPAVLFDVYRDGDEVVARLQWQTKSLFPAISSTRAFGVIDRSFRVRVEEQQ